MSIRKFGLIFILGLFLLSIGISAVAAGEYTIVPSTSQKTYIWTATSDTNWDGTGNEITSDNYYQLSSIDGMTMGRSAAGGDYKRYYTRHEFNLTKIAAQEGFSINDITQISFVSLGRGSNQTLDSYGCGSYYHGFYGAVYDYESQVWRSSNISGLTGTWSHSEKSYANVSFTITTNISNYIQGGILKAATRSLGAYGGTNQYCSPTYLKYEDYVGLKITYSTYGTPTWTVGGTPVAGATYSTAPGIQFTCPASGSCKVQVSASESFSSLVHESDAMGAGTYTYTSYTLPSATTYYVRIVNGVSTYSTTKSFIYSTPGAFSISAPAADLTNISLPYNLQWGVPSGGSGGYTYAVQVAPNSNWSTNEGQRLVNVTGVSGTSYTLTSAHGFTNGQTYYARIIATDSGGQTSTSGTRSFVISNVGTPAISSPTNGATVGLPFTITWGAVSGGTSPYTYTVKVGANEYGVGSATSYQVTSAASSVSLQVMATDATAKTSSWSSAVTVSVSNPTPTSIISPLQGATVASPFTINWTDVGGGATYRIFLCENTCGSLAVSSTGVATSTDNVRESPIKYSATGGQWIYTSPSSLTNGPWVARVYTIDSNGIYSSTYASVQLTVSNLVGPQVSSPSAGQAISKVADVTWTAATGGAGSYLYRMRICKNSSCSPSNMIVVDKTVQGVLTTNIPSGALDDGGYYYMQVQATENITGGATTAWSQIRGFSVTQSAGSTLSRPNILVPGLTGLSTTTAPTITWESIGNNITYTIQVADNALFASPVYTATTTSLSQTVPLSSLSAGRYYVRIMGANYLNQESPWSVVREFQYNTASTPVVLECSPACTTGQTCTNGVCVEIPVTANEVRGTFVEVPKQLELGQSYFFKANMMSTASTTEGTFNVRIFSGATTLYTSSFTMQVSPQGDYKGITIDIPPDLEVPAGTYTIQVTDSRGVVVASAEVPLKTSTNPLDSIMGGDITTIAIVAGCAGLAIVSYIAMKSVFSKTKGKEKAAAKRVALRLRNSVKTKRKTPRRQAKVQKHQKKKQRRR